MANLSDDIKNIRHHMKKVLTRDWAIATKEFIGDENGNLKRLKLLNLEWKSTEDGRASAI